MVTEARHQLIKELLEEENIVKLQDMVQLTGSSESTIRRDLSTLEAEGILVRVHGGAKRGHKLLTEPEMATKSILYMKEKKAIAAKAVSLINEGDIIFLDAGSTTYEMIPLLQGKNIVVVTNGVPHATLLADFRVKSIILGGEIKLQTKAIIGSTSIAQLDQYRFNKVFLGINAIHLTHGYTTPDLEEAAVKKKAITKSDQVFILADESKFGEVTFVKVGDIAECDVISFNLSERRRKLLEEQTTYWEAKV